MHNSIYLKISGVTGESKDANHIGWIDVHSFSWKLRQPTETNVGGGGGSGRLIVKDLEIYSRMDKALPTLMSLGAEGKQISEVKLVICKSGNQQDEYLKIILKNSVLSKVEFLQKNDKNNSFFGSAVSFGDIGIKYKFSPSIIELNYHEQDENGNPGPQVSFTWNVKSNTH